MSTGVMSQESSSSILDKLSFVQEKQKTKDKAEQCALSSMCICMYCTHMKEHIHMHVQAAEHCFTYMYVCYSTYPTHRIQIANSRVASVWLLKLMCVYSKFQSVLSIANQDS